MFEFCILFLYSSPYRSRPISVITPPVSPTPEQISREQHDTSKSKDSIEQPAIQQDGSVSSEDYIVPQSNGTAMETFLSGKPQTTQKKFLAAGLNKSSGNSLAEKNGGNFNDENHRTVGTNFESGVDEQIFQETGDNSAQLPDVRVDQGKNIDSNLENLFNV